MSRKAAVLFLVASFHYPPLASFCASFSLHVHIPRRHPKRRFARLQLSSIHVVHVYDNTFGADACSLLHDLATEHSERCHGGSIFLRTSQQKEHLTPLEKAMDTILQELNDTSPVVEYWSRSSYINMDAHADIDENTLKQDGVLRCPRNAHVLYMQVAHSGQDVGGNDHETTQRMGPTIVFPKKRVAWGSVTPITSGMGTAEEEAYVVDVENYWDDETKMQNGYTSSTSATNVDMVIVPALNGRLLRFDGRAFHAVPKPPHRYLMSQKQLKEYLDNEEQNCQDENYWDDDMEDDPEMERSVLLFNTWPGENSGPRGVLPDRAVADVPDGIVIEGGVDDAYPRQMEEERRRDWQEEYGDDLESVRCNGMEEWSLVPVERTGDGDIGTVVVPLMGNPSRRGCNFKEEVLKGPIHSLEQKFYESERVSLVEFNHDTH